MATSYPDFYNYLNTYEGSKLLEQLKKTINADTILWSDMEAAFGEYTSQIRSKSDFISLYEELSEQLQIHLKSENSKFIPTSEKQEKFKKDFTLLELYLGDLDKRRFNKYLARYRGESKNFYVMTLNYTNTLEKLLSIDKTKSNNEKIFDNGDVLRSIVHVHGELGSSIIIGVDNEMQIKNEIFRNPPERLYGTLYSSARNPTIAKLFRFAKLSENVGFGISKLMSWKGLTGNEVTIRSERDYVLVTLYLKSDVVDATQKTTQKTTQKLTAQQRSIIDYLSTHPYASRKELSKNIIDITENGIKYNLNRLQQIGLLKRVGPDKGGHWEVIENIEEK